MQLSVLLSRRRVWGIFFLIAVSIGGVFFVLSRTGVLSQPLWQHPYWSSEGQFTFSGGHISSLQASSHFFTGARAFSEIRSSFNQMDPTLPERKSLLYFFEYPCCTLGENVTRITDWFDGEVENAERMLSEGMIEGNAHMGYPTMIASFRLMSGRYTGAIIYSLQKDLLMLGHESRIKIFLINQKGEIVDKKKMLRTDSDEKKQEFIQFLVHTAREQNPGVPLLPQNEFFSESIELFFEEPEFAFSEDNVVFFFSPGIIGPHSSGIITIEVPYTEVAEWMSVIPPVSDERPKKQDGITSIDGKKYVALTFDDGPSNKTTPRLLDILKQHNVQATFYVLGSQAERFPEILKRTFDEGHEIGNHSWNHPSFTTISLKEVASQIASTNTVIHSIIGETPKTMRPPYGAYNKAVREIVGMPLIMWSVDTLDWKHRNANKGVELALKQTHDGAIILFHDIHASSVDAIPTLIAELRARGYEFVTVSELYEKYHQTSFTSGQVCFSVNHCQDPQ